MSDVKGLLSSLLHLSKTWLERKSPCWNGKERTVYEYYIRYCLVLPNSTLCNVLTLSYVAPSWT